MTLLKSGGKVEGGDGPYRTLVNKADANMAALARRLNEQAEEGYALHSVTEQSGNLILIFERLDLRV